MGHILSVTSQKGGVGKTTTALQIGSISAERGQRVLVIDADPQGGAIYALNPMLAENTHAAGLFQVFCGEIDLVDAATPCNRDGLFVVGCGLPNSGFHQQVFEDATRATGLFRESLQSANEHFDLIIIDCPPGLGLVCTAALAASDSAVLPIQCEPLSLRTLPPLIQQLIEIKQSVNHALEIAGILITMYDPGNEASESVHRQIRQCFFDDLVFKTLIPRDPGLNAIYMPTHASPSNESQGILAYRRLVDEMEILWHTNNVIMSRRGF